MSEIPGQVGRSRKPRGDVLISALTEAAFEIYQSMSIERLLEVIEELRSKDQLPTDPLKSALISRDLLIPEDDH